MVSLTKPFSPSKTFQSITKTWSSCEHISVKCSYFDWLITCVDLYWLCLTSRMVVLSNWVSGPTQRLSFYIIRLCLPYALKPIIASWFQLAFNPQKQNLKFHLSIIYPYATPPCAKLIPLSSHSSLSYMSKAQSKPCAL
jgi:hypothetical protein